MVGYTQTREKEREEYHSRLADKDVEIARLTDALRAIATISEDGQSHKIAIEALDSISSTVTIRRSE